MSQTEQYPLMTTLIHDFNANKSEEVLNFPEAQSEYENDIIIEIVGNFRGWKSNLFLYLNMMKITAVVYPFEGSNQKMID